MRWQADLAEITGSPPGGASGWASPDWWASRSSSCWCWPAEPSGGCFAGSTAGCADSPPRAWPPASAVTVSVLVGALAVDRLQSALVTTLSRCFPLDECEHPGRRGTADQPSFVSGGPVPPSVAGPGLRAVRSSRGDTHRTTGVLLRPVRSDPIRVFVGIDSAYTGPAAPALVVEELERFGAFDRAVIAIGTSAGSGNRRSRRGHTAGVPAQRRRVTASRSIRFRSFPLRRLTDPPRSPSRGGGPDRRARSPAAVPARAGRDWSSSGGLGAYGANGAFAEP